MSIKTEISELNAALPEGVTLVAVSKTYPASDIAEAYEAGQRIFGESRPQELKEKYAELPKDISWHMIGHLQTNKVKYIAPFVELIHSVDSLRLLETIDKEAAKNDRIINVLLEVYIAQEESKHGWAEEELTEAITAGAFARFANIRVKGLMGIASFTDDMEQVRGEFESLNRLFVSLKDSFGKEFDTLSMGMTSDYELAIECGSNMVRIGSKIFGARDYSK